MEAIWFWVSKSLAEWVELAMVVLVVLALWLGLFLWATICDMKNKRKRRKPDA